MFIRARRKRADLCEDAADAEERDGLHGNDRVEEIDRVHGSPPLLVFADEENADDSGDDEHV